MNKTWMLSAIGLAAISAGCGGNQEQKETVVVTDTIVKTETVVVPAAIDSAAIVAYYEAAHAKAKGAHQEKHTVHAESKKKVRVDSHLPVEHHDALVLATPVTPASAPAAADAAAPAQAAVVVLHDTEVFYYRPDEKASFPGGEQAFDKYLIQNIKYPSEAVRLGITGTVHAIMFLDETGKVVKVEFAGKELGYGLEAETRRLLLNSPRWNPAKHGGAAVKSKFGLPVSFELNG